MLNTAELQLIQLGSPQQSSGGQEIRRTRTNLAPRVPYPPLALPRFATDDGVPKESPQVDNPLPQGRCHSITCTSQSLATNMTAAVEFVDQHTLVKPSTIEIKPIKVGFPVGSSLGSLMACPEQVGATLNEPPVQKDHQGSADRGKGPLKL